MVPEYLEQNTDRIRNLGEQDLGAWNAKYDSQVYYELESLNQLKDMFPDHILNRERIVTLFRNQEYYHGFVAAMIWGYIGTQPKRGHAGDFTTTNLYMALSHDRDAIVDSIIRCRKDFIQGQFTNPFNRFKTGEDKIPGVDHSFFTKIFFFLGQAMDEVLQKPLIFDKWTQNAFYALLLQCDDTNVDDFFTPRVMVHIRTFPKLVNFRTLEYPENIVINKPGEVTPSFKRTENHIYLEYITRMNAWADELEVPVDKLEQFVFGYQLRPVIPNQVNPRIELWQIIMNHLLNQ